MLTSAPEASQSSDYREGRGQEDTLFLQGPGLVPSAPSFPSVNSQLSQPQLLRPPQTTYLKTIKGVFLKHNNFGLKLLKT